MKVPHDFEDTELKVGDEVICIPYKGAALHRGKITGRSPQQVRIEVRWTIPHGPRQGEVVTYEYLRPPEHIYKN